MNASRKKRGRSLCLNDCKAYVYGIATTYTSFLIPQHQEIQECRERVSAGLESSKAHSLNITHSSSLLASCR
jgi:hypothetical protein